jgi:twinfilin
MLYASSRATLISTLGLRGQRLAHQIIATSKSDLTFPVLTSDPLPSLSDLSLREKEIAEIKAAEAEGAHGTSKRTTNLISSSGVAFPVSEDARNALAALVHPQGDPEGEELVQLVTLVLVYWG